MSLMSLNIWNMRRWALAQQWCTACNQDPQHHPCAIFPCFFPLSLCSLCFFFIPTTMVVPSADVTSKLMKGPSLCHVAASPSSSCAGHFSPSSSGSVGGSWGKAQGLVCHAWHLAKMVRLGVWGGWNAHHHGVQCLHQWPPLIVWLQNVYSPNLPTWLTLACGTLSCLTPRIGKVLKLRSMMWCHLDCRTSPRASHQ